MLALRQPYKDTGLKFGGNPVTKPDGIGHLAHRGTEDANCRRITGRPRGTATGDVFLRNALRKIRASKRACDRTS